MSAAAEPATSSGTWHEANQKRLAAQLEALRSRLERWVAAAGIEISAGVTNIRSDDRENWAFPQLPALEQLCRCFGLTDFEREMLLLCAGAEMDSRIAQICMAAERRGRPMPTFGMVLAALPDAHWSALSPARPLRYWQLIDTEPADTLMSSGLRINERILHYLAGVSAPDVRLHDLAVVIPAPDSMPASYQELAEKIASAWASGLSLPPSETSPENRLSLIELCGDQTRPKGTIAANAAALLQLRLYSLDARALPQNDPAESRMLLRLWEREAILSEAALFLDWPDRADSAADGRISAMIERIQRPLALGVRQPSGGIDRTRVIFTVEKPTRAEQTDLWRDALREHHPDAANLNGAIDALVAQFSLTPSAIRSAARQAGSFAREADDSLHPGGRLWDACRTHARPRLEGLAERIEVAAAWDDLILPAKEMDLLRRMCVCVRNRTRVYEHWGFEAKGHRGLGMSALFAGPSGTGKTMAAEVMARELRLDLFRIDLSQTVSKYIGETEKNLRQVFDAAEDGAALLVFDEADALFGKRTEVKDSHDRYANIEVSYLLQRMEAYRGLAILTTNRRNAIDQAFLRRIRFVVDFPFPETGQRAEIWRRVFPDATPTENLRIEKLSALRVAGGNIHNIALGAAFLAADAQQPVRMEHVVAAARSEFAKLDMPFAETEVAGWA